MIRAILIYLSKASWALRLVTGWHFARRAASRFIAGDTLEEALEVIQTLNARGLFVTLDHLGENVNSSEKALTAAEDYLQSLLLINKAGVESNISVKLTQLGLNIDMELCLSNLRRIATRAADFGIMVRADIEDFSTVDRTWQVFRTLRAEGVTNIGLAVQSYLYRSEEDTKQLLSDGAHFRLCKGAYRESPDVAYPRKADVDANFDRLAMILIDASLIDGEISTGKVPPVAAIATHDPARIDFAREYREKVGLPKEALEFQMLHGIRSDLQQELKDAGYPVRIYVPYGIEWYPYFMRRLAERPANLWFFLSNIFRG
ncbi:MAG: proline dehydrogenase family protein [Anaerolineaceae bacterium]|nr:MAG: proline dehydrogenase family protein [Anaerolineaceae bacterium]